ncbi:MAG: hypothetical protein ACJA04_000789 [Cellvibrionaceae bacterium]
MVFDSEKSGCDILINYRRIDAKVQLKLPVHWRIQPVDEVVMQLREAFGKESLSLIYH